MINKKMLNKTVLKNIKMLTKEEEQKQLKWQKQVIKEEYLKTK